MVDDENVHRFEVMALKTFSLFSQTKLHPHFLRGIKCGKCCWSSNKCCNSRTLCVPRRRLDVLVLPSDIVMIVLKLGLNLIP